MCDSVDGSGFQRCPLPPDETVLRRITSTLLPFPSSTTSKDLLIKENLKRFFGSGHGDTAGAMLLTKSSLFFVQDRTVKALDEASKLAAPVQPDAGASVAAAIPVLVPYVPQAMPLPVPVDALYVSSQMPVMTQRRILGARVRRFPKLHSQTTVDDVASYIALLPGCARCSETFRRHQIDGKALLRLRKQCLILRMKIDLAPALKIVAAIDWLRQAGWRTRTTSRPQPPRGEGSGGVRDATRDTPVVAWSAPVGEGGGGQLADRAAKAKPWPISRSKKTKMQRVLFADVDALTAEEVASLGDHRIAVPLEHHPCLSQAVMPAKDNGWGS
ncbi:hypothetical protein HPB51_026418 [Rhipicephalus microplus]|uniref:SAM domain-containing protein n=1 Tax=Rhipicephalus microplus TaxID=6941 RepID=A0A9J6D343_RHIMP|nr:hypothetical protein HPB51_026418 [Rhipicephalus microplus]